MQTKFAKVNVNFCKFTIANFANANLLTFANLQLQIQLTIANLLMQIEFANANLTIANQLIELIND